MNTFQIILISFIFGVVIAAVISFFISRAILDRLKRSDINTENKKLKATIKELQKKAEAVKNEKKPDTIDDLISDFKSISR